MNYYCSINIVRLRSQQVWTILSGLPKSLDDKDSYLNAFNVCMGFVGMQMHKFCLDNLLHPVMCPSVAHSACTKFAAIFRTHAIATFVC